MQTLQNLPDLGNVVDIDGTGGRDYAQFLGGRRYFDNIDRTTATRNPRRTKDGAWLGAVFLKNASGGVLLPKRLARLDTSGTAGGGVNYLHTQVAGYGNAALLRSVVLVDPWIPSAGVADGKGFWGIIYGPAPGMTPQLQGTFEGAVTQGLPVVCTGDANGRISGPDTTPDDAADAMNHAFAVLGTAEDSAATSETSHDVWVFWNIPIF